MKPLFSRRAVLKAMAAGSAVSLLAPAIGHAVEDTALVSRDVEAVADPSGRILLGDGHLLLALSLIHPDPVGLICAWQGDLLRHSARVAEQYRAVAPGIDTIPVVGEASPDTFSVEAALASAPAVAILAGCYGPGPEDDHVISRLEEAGIPVVFVDFYVDPLNNTAPSMRAIGRIFGGAIQEKAEAFAAFHEERLARVVDRLDAAGPERPSVLMQAHAGAEGWNCFWMPGRAGLGRFIEAAGGVNIGDQLSSVQPWVQGSLEFVLATDPQHFVTTGGPYLEGRSGLVIGPGVEAADARRSLAETVAQAEIAMLSAVQQGRVHGLWHLLHATPLNIVAVEALAQWLHPDIFTEIDTAATLATINEEFLAVPLRGCVAVGI